MLDLFGLISVEDALKQKLLIALALMVFVPVMRGQVYTITDLGSLSPAAINTWGQVVGNRNGHAFMWTKFGGMRDLGTLQGGTFSRATAINDLGVVTGTADGPGIITWPDGSTENCNDLVQPFLWRRATGMRGLGSPAVAPVSFFPACALYTYANDINRYGQVVGGNRDFATYKFGFLWMRNNGMTQFRDAYQTAANGINNVGQVAGQTSFARLANISHAAFWDNGVMTDLGTLGGDSSDWFYCSGADDVNDLGQIVGWSQLASDNTGCFLDFIFPSVHAILWRAGAGMKDLGTLAGDTSSVALKVNFFGRIIGSSGNTVVWQNGENGGLIQVIGRPFVWSRRSGMRDLNSLIASNSGWALNSATGINIWGQIVGSGTRNGQAHGFLLTPKVLFQH